MNKKGFTLVEVLAVIVILSLVIGIAGTSVVAVRNNSLKKLVETKYNNLEKSAILYGQENQDELNEECTIDNEKYSYCRLIDVNTLIINNYYETSETNGEGNKDLINNLTKKSMLEDEIMIYRKNNVIYAKVINKKSEM